jgi:hypothetical protein
MQLVCTLFFCSRGALLGGGGGGGDGGCVQRRIATKQELGMWGLAARKPYRQASNKQVSHILVEFVSYCWQLLCMVLHLESNTKKLIFYAPHTQPSGIL